MQGRVCVLLFCVRSPVFVSAQGTKEQNKPEVAWQHKTYPKWTLRMQGQLVEEREKDAEMERSGVGGGGGGWMMLWLQYMTHDFREEARARNL